MRPIGFSASLLKPQDRVLKDVPFDSHPEAATKGVWISDSLDVKIFCGVSTFPAGQGGRLFQRRRLFERGSR